MNATIEISPGGAYFEGHFPGRPILPAVAQLALVVDVLTRSARVPSALRAIPFMRLRQLVAPGDRLQLTARGDGGGRVRIEVKRDGALVANGELVLGRIEPRRDSPRAQLRASQPTIGSQPIETLLPHRSPMRFVESIVAETPDGLTCAARIPAACALAAGGSAPALAALEAAAQTAAVWEAVRRSRENGIAGRRVGYLVALRDVTLFADRVPAEENLIASARLTAAAPPLTHYAVDVTLDARRVLEGTVATFLTDALLD